MRRDVVVLILAGGRGTRLWPLSTPACPKPFRRLFGDEPVLASVARQASRWVGDPSSVWIAIGEDQRAAARAALPEIDRHTLLIEPHPAETTVAIAAAALRLAAQRPDAVLVVLAADQHLLPADALLAALDRAVAVARSGPYLVSLGVPPERPSPAYGYMELGAPIGRIEGAFEGVRYIEKPDADLASRLLAEGRYLWNVGLFVFRAGVLLAALRRHIPAAMPGLARGEWPVTLRAIDHELMERVRPDDPERHAFVEARCTFHDLGNLDALASTAPVDARGNRSLGDVTLADCDDCVVLGEPPRRVRVTGLRGAIVAVSEAGDTLIASRAARAAAPLSLPLVSEGQGCRPEHAPVLVRTEGAPRGSFEGPPGVEIRARQVSDLRVRIVGDEVEVSRDEVPRVEARARQRLTLRPCADEQEIAAQSAALVVETLAASLALHGRATLVPSSGRSVVGCYTHLARHHRHSLDWSRVEVIQMDEPIGVADEQTARAFLERMLLGPLGIGRAHLLRSVTAAEAQRLESRLLERPADLVIHGVGTNGHLGLNEPGSALDSGARQVTLASSTRDAWTALHGASLPAPTHAVTLGLAALLGARSSLLIATGAHKRAALAAALLAPVRMEVPASGLQRASGVTVLADPAALGTITADLLAPDGR